jgi:hypothetical protein
MTKDKANPKVKNYSYTHGSKETVTGASSSHGQPMTMDDLYCKLVSRYDQTDKKIDNLSSAIDELKQGQTELSNRLNSLEQQNSHLTRKHAEVEQQVKDLKTATQMEFTFMKNDFAEERERLKRLNNLILMGVEESEDGLLLAKQLLDQLLPGIQVRLDQKLRIGKPNADNRPRPLRIPLNNSLDRRSALEAYRNLPNKEHFGGVYPKSDLTKRQQELRQMQSKSQTDRTSNKRPADARLNSQVNKARRTQSVGAATDRFGFQSSPYQTQQSQFNNPATQDVMEDAE